MSISNHTLPSSRQQRDKEMSIFVITVLTCTHFPFIYFFLNNHYIKKLYTQINPIYYMFKVLKLTGPCLKPNGAIHSSWPKKRYFVLICRHTNNYIPKRDPDEHNWYQWAIKNSCALVVWQPDQFQSLHFHPSWGHCSKYYKYRRCLEISQRI